MGKKLTDLTERTATADTDLVHVNSGGVDYKESKDNFLGNKVPRNIAFSNTSAITTQFNNLEWGPYVGYVDASTSTAKTATGMPETGYFAISGYKYSANDIVVHADNLRASHSYTRRKSNASWGSWIEDPERAEISARPTLTYTGILEHSASATVSGLISGRATVVFLLYGTYADIVLANAEGAHVFDGSTSGVTASVSNKVLTLNNTSSRNYRITVLTI